MFEDDTLPIPYQCDVCNSPNVIFTTNDVVYGVKRGKWPYSYFCKDCRAIVGCHDGTNKPLGRMANSKTRRLRRDAHNVFDRLWHNGYLTRSDAYNALAEFLCIAPNDCHISWLSDIQLKITIEWAKLFMLDNPPLHRRQVKQNAKKLERFARESKHVKRRKTERKFRRARSY